MDIALLLPALLFGIVGLALVGVAAWVLWGALFGNSRSWGERARFKRREDLLKRVDVAIGAKDFPGALKLIEGSLFFDHIKSDVSLIEKILGHHMGVLGRLLAVGEELDLSLSNVAVIEDLMQARCELMRSYAEAASARDALRRNRKKVVPRWALDEYDRKMVEIAERLTINLRSLNSQVAAALGVLKTPAARHDSQADGEGGVTIH